MGKIPRLEIPPEEKPTKQQRLELVRLRLVPGDRIPLLTRHQADGLIRREHARRIRNRVGKILATALVLLAAAYGAFEGWRRWDAGESDQPSASVLSTWSFGDWERWITDPKVIVVKEIPSDTLAQLQRQTDLFRGILSKRGENPDSSSREEEFERMRNHFPSGETVTASYSNTTRNLKASSGEDYASISATSHSSTSSGTKGVLKSYLNGYAARIGQLRFENASEQVESLRGKLDRDIADLESRSVSNSTSMSAQTEATLKWLKGDVRPYLENFQKSLLEGKADETMNAWNQFESTEKPSMENVIDRIALENHSLNGYTIEVPKNHSLLLDATVGTRRMIFLPADRSEIRVEFDEEKAIEI